MDANHFRMLALAFPETEESPHHEKSSFKVKKKIFATLNEAEDRATLRLSLMDQSIFCAIDENIIYPVPNKWGKQGWTHIAISNITLEMLEGILIAAYCEVAPKKLAAPYLAAGEEDVDL